MPDKNTQSASLTPRELADIKLAERERFQLIDAGLIDHPFVLRPCRMKILILVDDGISFNQYYFGLSEVLDTLRQNPEWWVNFSVTRAHRHTDPNHPAAGSPAEPLYAPHFENFHFDQPGFNIDEYHQVWFYGFNSGAGQAGSCSPINGIPPSALTDRELGILFAWMDKGGGVFATGDHFTLGEALCSRIPRVRNMRKWTVADGVPTNFGPDRHDTLRSGYDRPGTALDESTRYTFDDESDDLPMHTRLRWYHDHYCIHQKYRPSHWRWPYFYNRSPHPVLCGRTGPIDILPDHPHEGEVVVPKVLTETLTYCGYGAREYPDYLGSPLSPEIIAWARVQNDHTDTNDTNKGKANGLEFGAVGAYNGHCVNVGRVVTDSTWHHWFDVNLTGRMQLFSDIPGNIETGDTRKLNGFNDTAAGQATLERIRNYYRNVAIWLAPPAVQKCMAARALWGALQRYPLKADLRLSQHVWEIGHHAIDALGHYAGKCNVKQWWQPFIQRELIARLMDPRRLTVPVEALNMIDDFAIGGILHAMLEAQCKEYPPGKHPDSRALESIAERGAQQGLAALAEHIREMAQTNDYLGEVLSSGGRKASAE